MKGFSIILHIGLLLSYWIVYNRFVMLVDKRIYNDACISKAVYHLSNEMVITRSSISDSEELLAIRCDKESEAKAEERLINVLNDYKLRTIIENETHDIKTILYAKAFIDDEDIDLPETDYV